MSLAEGVGGIGGGVVGFLVSLNLAAFMPTPASYPFVLHFVWAAIIAMGGYAIGRGISRSGRRR